MRRPTRFLTTALALLGFLGASCGSTDSDSAATTPITVAATAAPTTDAPTTDVPTAVAATDAHTTAPAVTGDITVFAAASLTAAFTEIGDAFMVENPDAKVTFNFAASSELVTQIGEGAPADVFASADLSNMTKLTDAGKNASEPVVFATNLAEIIVGAGNPKGITGVADLANPGSIAVVCAPEVPCGKYAATIFKNAGVTVTPKSLEENVKAVVAKVTLGEADAGIVYKTDVTAAGDTAEGVEIPADINVVAKYPIAVTKEAANADGAQAFIDFVNSEQGQKILTSYGFLVP
jgi:molybdate transport system substrate-binding protein